MAVNVNKLEKFSGDKGSIRPESWLKLYELETGKLDEVDRINNLIYYLSKDALEWFADEILSNASIKKWDTVKLKLIQRFGYKVESPIVAASKRRLKKEETVEDYFRDKIRLLNQTSLNNVGKLKMLTDGLPLDWKNYLVTAQPKDPSHWMQIAMEIEQNNNQIRQQQRRSVEVFLKIHSKLVGCKLHVVKNFSYPLLIGLDVAGKIGLIIDTKDKAVYVKGNECFYISPETHLPSVQQKELNQLLKENQALFSQHETDIGRIAVQHKIHTIEHPPISCRPYRRPLAEYDEIKRQVEELSKKGLIRESQSPWAFPVVLVSKKDGSQRMCIDYRKLNAITIDDKQPLPYIQDMFDRLHNAKYFTTLDIAWGYWHVEIHPDSVEKTAFITNDGHYEFLVMPFDLKNAPSTFQRIIQHIIGNLLWNGVCNYQDDILIYSSTFEDHIELLKKIFDKLKENNIKLKLKKCSFAKQEIRYLGHIIGHNKIKPDPEKTKAINEFPHPKTVKQVRQFLGLAGYYRKFIPKFSEIADPLTSLTRKNKLFKWTTEVNKSFQELKSHLSTDPVLSTYDPSLPCKLYTDASKLGIGAILAQIGNDNQEHVISYYSGKLLPHQQNYSAFELECFAVVQSVEYFEVYLENNTFEVNTDHSALEWLFNVKKPKAKYLRWIIELSTKSMKIVHRSGSKQTHVDALSRSPVSFHISIPTLRLHQQKADLSFVKNSHIHRDLIMVKHNGVLKTVVPESFQEEILKEYHDNHSHPSINKTVKLITPFYWWPNAIRCIKDYVRSCKICQITKCSHKPFIGEYVAPNSDLKPLELISMDTIVLGSAANETKYKYIQSNGLCEKMNDTILTKLRTNLQENPRLKWSSLLAKIVKDYNSTPHDVTGFSPNFLLFGDCAIPEFSESPHFTIENARKKAIENSAKHREKWKARHDAKHPQSSFKVGDLVLRKIASNDPRKIKITKHNIHTVPHPPIQLRPYRISASEYDEIKRQVEDLKKKGLVRDSRSPWAFSVTLVPKADGQKRLCVDYRRLNALTIDDKMPLPNIQEVIDRLQGAKYFTSLDIASGYWHVEMAPDSTEKTAFITNEGLYEWLVMPFGLKNAPATFQQIIQQTLGPLMYKGCINYLDDFIIYSKTLEEHFDLLSEVLEKLYSQNLKLKLQNCSFIREEIEYLGYIIKYNQVTPSPRKIEAVKSFPIPKTVKTIQQFHGLCSYYRRFIKDFSSIAQPLADLLKKDKIFHWSEIHQKAFKTLKNLITQPPVLAMYDPTSPCKLYTDASEQGLGAILAQKHPDGRERVVSYFSKRLNPTQSRYTATELECFAIIKAVRHFNNYLDKPFQIVTDHSALKWLLNHKNPGGRLFRWSMELSSRSFTIIHRAGGQQTDVDALSRNPVCTFITEDKMKIVQQQADLRFVKNPQIKSGIVTIRIRGHSKAVVPDSLRAKCLHHFHDDFGHPGKNKTLKLISTYYWWPQMLRTIKEYVSSCKVCQLSKQSNQPTIGHYQIPDSDLQPFDLIGLDTIVLGNEAKNTRHKYLQVIIDHHSRYIWASPTASNNSAAILNILRQLLSSGVPIKHILTDNGSNFTSRSFKYSLSENKIAHSLATPYHPQTCGMLRRSRRLQSLPPLLVEMVKEEEKPHVQPAAFTYLQQPRNPPNFSGKGSELAHLWLKDYSRVAAYNGWDESMCLANVVFFLEGAARCWFDNVEESITTWNTFKEEFTRTFGDKEDYARRIESSLKVRAQKPDESVELYIQDVLNLCRQLNPNMSEEDRVGHLMKGVAENIYRALLAIEVTTTGEFTQHCRRIEKLNKNRISSVRFERIPTVSAINENEYHPLKEMIREIIREELRSAPNELDNLPPPQGLEDRVWQRVEQNLAPIDKAPVFHSRRAVKNFRSGQQNAGEAVRRKTDEFRTRENIPICFYCNRPGHVAKHCWDRRRDRDENEPSRTQSRFYYGRRRPGSIYMSDFMTPHMEQSDRNNSPRRNLPRSSSPYPGRGRPMTRRRYSRSPDRTPSRSPHRDRIFEFLVLPNCSHDAILGWDFLESSKAVIDCGHSEISFSETLNEDQSAAQLHLASDDIIPPKCTKRVLTRTPSVTGIKNCAVEGARQLFLEKELFVPSSYLTIWHGQAYLWVTNFSKHPKTIPSGMCLAHLFRVQPQEVCPIMENHSNNKSKSAKSPIRITNFECREENFFKVGSSEQLMRMEQISACISPELPLLHKTKLLELFENFSEVFGPIDKTTSRIITKHRINTGDAKPSKKMPYRVSPSERKVIQEEVDRMMEMGVVQPSESPWASPVVLVRKKDGSVRFCVDYRGLNKMTKKDVYPLPRVDDALDCLKGANIYSTIDLKAGYWQIGIDEADREKTAFITPDGLFEFKVMPFGLCNAPATFERMMDNLLKGLRWTICLCYLDDVVIFADNFPDHLRRLEVVLNCFKRAGLKLNPGKCSFGASNIKILGHQVDKDGIRPDDDKIKAVSQFPIPKNLQQLRSFLGLSSYYRRFIKNYADIARPLNSLLSKGTKFQWNTDQERAFQKLKNALTSKPVLGHFDDDAPTELHTDASGYGIGAVLAQKQGNGEKVIAYASRTLLKSEKNYSTTERECLAIVWAIGKFRPYLFGRPFKVITDHHSLCWLTNLKDPAGRLARWALRLQEYDVSIVYKTGRMHKDADCLSRNPIENTEKVFNDDIPTLFLLSDISKEQEKDPYITGIIKEISQPSPAKKDNKFEVVNGILYRKNYDPTGLPLLLVIPRHLRMEILGDLHDAPTAGHLGFAKTYDRIRRRFYWPGMYRSVRRYVGHCQDCQRRKSVPQLPPGYLRPIPPPDRPFQKVGIDLLGRFPISQGKKKWIVVCTDYLTKYAVTQSLGSGGAQEIAKFLLEEVILKHGAPREIVMDRGRNFQSRLIQELTKNCHIKKKTTTAYHPQTNGLTERLNRTIADMLSMYMDLDQKNWDEMLPFITFAYNTARQESTGFTPFFLVHGREAETTLDTIFPYSSASEGEEFIQLVASRAEEARQIARHHIFKAQETNKLNYDARHKGKVYQPGDLVWIFTPIRRVGLSEKLLKRYFGPYKVIKKISDVTYEVEAFGKSDKRRKGRDTVHILRMKPYYDPSRQEDSS
ncbi:hypothetical protein LAZ67_2002542, partial [Cordylochernes scorpioides]